MTNTNLQTILEALKANGMTQRGMKTFLSNVRHKSETIDLECFVAAQASEYYDSVCSNHEQVKVLKENFECLLKLYNPYTKIDADRKVLINYFPN